MNYRKIVKQKGTRTWKFENLPAYPYGRKWEACSEENTKGIAEKPLNEEIVGLTQGLNCPSQQQPGIEMELYQQIH